MVIGHKFSRFPICKRGSLEFSASYYSALHPHALLVPAYCVAGDAVAAARRPRVSQTTTPAGGGNGGPDGVCHGDTVGNNASGPTQSGYCDCGRGVSCGEYLWGEPLPPSARMAGARELSEQRHRQITGTGRC